MHLDHIWAGIYKTQTCLDIADFANKPNCIFPVYYTALNIRIL